MDACLHNSKTLLMWTVSHNHFYIHYIFAFFVYRWLYYVLFNFFIHQCVVIKLSVSSILYAVQNFLKFLMPLYNQV